MNRGLTGRGSRRPWWFLDVFVEELSDRDARPVVALATLPEGASPPLHVHHDLDDSFFMLDGCMVVRCGDDVDVVTAGDWVPFPRGAPHTFRVLDGPARVLMVHADDSFLAFARAIGTPADAGPRAHGPDADTLAHLMAAHGMETVGECMEEDEARALLVHRRGSRLRGARLHGVDVRS